MVFGIDKLCGKLGGTIREARMLTGGPVLYIGRLAYKLMQGGGQTWRTREEAMVYDTGDTCNQYCGAGKRSKVKFTECHIRMLATKVSGKPIFSVPVLPWLFDLYSSLVSRNIFCATMAGDA